MSPSPQSRAFSSLSPTSSSTSPVIRPLSAARGRGEEV
jgi:hypothetical protein